MYMFKKQMLFTLLVVLASLSIGFGQNSSSDYKQEGQIISEGENKTPNGELGVTSYRLEQIELTKPFDLEDGKSPINKAFRIVILMEKPPPLGTYLIHIDELKIHPKEIKPNVFAGIVYERTLPNGATLALSKLDAKGVPHLSVLLEKLTVPSDYATSIEEINASIPVIEIRRVVTRSLNRVQIKVSAPRINCPKSVFRSVPLVLDIEGVVFSNIGCDGENVVGEMSAEEFNQLRDGAEISLKFAGSRTARRFVGYLNKSLIQ